MLNTNTPAAITDAERDLAAAAARPRTMRAWQGTGRYAVTVGGVVVGYVQKTEASRTDYWNALDVTGETEIGETFDTLNGGRRADAVSVVGRTDTAVRAYRDGARIGAFGIDAREAEEARIAAVMAIVDARPAPYLVLDAPANPDEDERPSEAETYARVTGSTGATVVHQRVDESGALVETGRSTFTRPPLIIAWSGAGESAPAAVGQFVELRGRAGQVQTVREGGRVVDVLWFDDRSVSAAAVGADSGLFLVESPCTCYAGCEDAGEPPHQHADEPCPVHPDRPVVPVRATADQSVHAVPQQRTGPRVERRGLTTTRYLVAEDGRATARQLIDALLQGGDLDRPVMVLNEHGAGWAIGVQDHAAGGGWVDVFGRSSSL